jgi:hypothetical protein
MLVSRRVCGLMRTHASPRRPPGLALRRRGIPRGDAFRRHPHRRVHAERRSDGGRPRVDGPRAPTARVGRRDRASQRCRKRSVEATGIFRGRTRLTDASARENENSWGNYSNFVVNKIRFIRLGVESAPTGLDRRLKKLAVLSRTLSELQTGTYCEFSVGCVRERLNSTRKKVS